MAKAKQWVRHIKRDVVALWLAARDPRVPLIAKAVVALVAAYALSPIDLIPVLGYVDDLILLPLGILLAVRLVPSALMAEFRDRATTLNRPSSRAGFIAILLIWLGLGVAASVWIWNRIQPDA